MRSIETTISAGAAALLAVSVAAGAGSCGNWDVVVNPTFEGADVLPLHIMPFGPGNTVGLGQVTGAGIVHMAWDGAAWTVTTTGSLGISPADMRGAVGLAPDDIWICGLTVEDAHGRPFLAHWDGQAWDATVATVLDNPSPNGGDPLRNAEGADLAVLAPDDIWVIGAGDSVGIGGGFDGGDFVACHWDGSNLEELEILPNIFNRINQVQNVDAAATDDIWAVGYGRNITESFHAAMYHWDGSSWTPIPGWTPLPGQNVVSETLWDVATPAPGDAWAVGDKLLLEDGNTRTVSLYLHWDGSSWTEVAGPDIGPLTSIADHGPSDVWVSCGFGEFGGRLAHFDGTSWTEVQSAPFPGATHIGLGRLATSGGCDVWAAGYWAIYDGAGGWEQYVNIIEHLQPPSACPADVTDDGVVNVFDLLELLANFGNTPPADTGGDLTGPSPGDPPDGVVNVFDLLELLTVFGQTCPI